MFRLSSVVLFALLAAGCGAKKAYKSGLSAEASGQQWRAAQYYLDSLDRRSGFEDPALALDRMGEDAFREAQRSAGKEEDSEDFLAAMSWYQQMKAYVARLSSKGRLGFTPGVDFDDKIQEMRAAAAYEAYARGELSIEQRRWSDALSHFAQALDISPGFKDTDLRIAECHYGWAVDDVSTGQYRSGATRFVQATSNQGPYEDSAVRAVELYAALGRHHLAAGTCRQAVRDLRLVHQQYPTLIAPELRAAENCAETAVLVEPFGNNSRVGDIRVADWLDSYLRRELPSATSEFVVLAATGARKDSNIDYVVSGRIVEAWVHDPSATTTARSTTGQRTRECGANELGPCADSVTVNFVQVDSSSAARVAASVSIVDHRTQRYVAQSEPIGEVTSTLSWIDNFTDAGGNAVSVSDSPSSSSVGIGSSLWAQRSAQRSHPSGPDMVRSALDNVGKRTLSAVVTAVDTEAPLVDPSSLAVVPLINK